MRNWIRGARKWENGSRSQPWFRYSLEGGEGIQLISTVHLGLRPGGTYRHVEICRLMVEEHGVKIRGPNSRHQRHLLRAWTQVRADQDLPPTYLSPGYSSEMKQLVWYLVYRVGRRIKMHSKYMTTVSSGNWGMYVFKENEPEGRPRKPRWGKMREIERRLRKMSHVTCWEGLKERIIKEGRVRMGHWHWQLVDERRQSQISGN